MRLKLFLQLFFFCAAITIVFSNPVCAQNGEIDIPASLKEAAQKTDENLLGKAAAVYDMTRTGSLWYFRLGEFRGLKNSFLEPMKDDFSIEDFDYRFSKTEIKEVEIDNPKP